MLLIPSVIKVTNETIVFERSAIIHLMRDVEQFMSIVYLCPSSTSCVEMHTYPYRLSKLSDTSSTSDSISSAKAGNKMMNIDK